MGVSSPEFSDTEYHFPKIPIISPPHIFPPPSTGTKHSYPLITSSEPPPFLRKKLSLFPMRVFGIFACDGCWGKSSG